MVLGERVKDHPVTAALRLATWPTIATPFVVAAILLASASRALLTRTTRWVLVAPVATASEPPIDRMAIVSLILGVGGLSCCFTAPVAIVLGLWSSRRIKASGGALGGRGIALAGWICGAISMVLYVGAFAFLGFYCGLSHSVGCS